MSPNTGTGRLTRLSGLVGLCLALSSCYGFDGELKPLKLEILSSSLPNATVGVTYSIPVSFRGGKGPYSWALTSGTLPAGLSLNIASGRITGIPTTAGGPAPVTVKVTDSQPPPDSDAADLSLSIDPALPVNVGTASLPNATVGKSYSVTLNASGGLAPYAWSVTSGSLPAGLSLEGSTGVISGIPITAGGPVSITVTATDSQSLPDSGNATLSITVDPAPPVTVVTSSLPIAMMGEAYSVTLSASGGLAPYTWSVSSGALPEGLVLNPSTGEISGTPTKADGWVPFTVRAADSQEPSDSDTGDLHVKVLSPGPRFAYVGLNGTVEILVRDSRSLRMRHAGYTYSQATGDVGLALHPSGKFVCRAGGNSNLVRIFSIDAQTGTLSLVETEDTGHQADWVVLHPQGTFAYVAHSFGPGAGISIYSFDGVTGALTPCGSAGTPGIGPSLTFGRTGEFLYATSRGSSAVTVYSVDPGTGALTEVGTAPTGTDPRNSVLHPSGRYLYVANNASKTVSSYSVDPVTGLLSYLGSAATTTYATHISISPAGTAVYVCDGSAGYIQNFAIDEATGALTHLQSAYAGFRSQVSPDGKRLFAVHYSYLYIFTIDPTTGLLTNTETVALRYRGDPLLVPGAPVEYTTKFAYVSNTGEDTISSYQVDSSDGTLAASGTTTSGTAPRRGSPTPDGKFLMVPNEGDDTVTSYAIDPTDGRLSAVNTLATGTGPTAAAVEPSGRFCYVANRVSSTVSAYSIDPSTGVLASIGTSIADGDPRTVAVDPIGAFLFVPNFTSGTVSRFRINPANGLLSLADSTIVGSQPLGAAMDTTGMYLYVTCYGGDTIERYYMNRYDDKVSFIESYATGNGPGEIRPDPTGLFLFHTLELANSVSYYARALSGGMAPAGTVPAAASPVAMDADASGLYLYVAVNQLNQLWRYAINRTTGAPESPVSFATGTDPGGVVTTWTSH